MSFRSPTGWNAEGWSRPAVSAAITPTETFAGFGGGGTSVALGGSIGAAASGDILLVIINNEGAVATGVTAGSTVLTKAVEEITAVSSLQIWYGTVTGSTTGTLTVTSGSSMFNVGTIMGFVHGSGSSSPSSTSTGVGSFADPGSVTITTPANGFSLSAFCMNATSTGSWTNASTFANISDGSNRFTSGLNTTAGSQTMTFPSGGNQNHLVALAWAP